MSNLIRVFDTTLQRDVEDMSSSIQVTLEVYRDRVSANIMYNILQFFATSMMEDIRNDAAIRVAEREAREAKEQNND